MNVLFSDLISESNRGEQNESISENESPHADDAQTELVKPLGANLSTNAELVKRVVFVGCNVKKGGVVWDVTHNEGSFISQRTEKELQVYHSDFFKNSIFLGGIQMCIHLKKHSSTFAQRR